MEIEEGTIGTTAQSGATAAHPIGRRGGGDETPGLGRDRDRGRASGTTDGGGTPPAVLRGGDQLLHGTLVGIMTTAAAVLRR
jgi:hypothetical protein